MLNNKPAVTAPPIVEAVPPVESTNEPAKPVVDSDRFAQLSAKEIKLQKEREQVKLELAQLNEQKTKLGEYKKQIDEFEELKKTDKIAALKKIGFTEEDILNFIANKEEPKEPTAAELAAKAAQDELQKFKDEQKADAERQQKERDEKNIKSFKDGIGQAITKEAEKYEYLNHNGEVAKELVYDTVLKYMADDQELSPMEAMKEAMEAVEEYYEQEFTSIMNLKKIQAKIKPAVEPTKEAEPQKKVISKATTKPVAPTPPARPETTPITTPTKETRAQKKERLAEILRNMGR